jgi:hypothetical protein
VKIARYLSLNQLRRFVPAQKELFRLTLGFSIGLIIVFLLKITPRHNLLLPQGPFFSKFYLWLLLIVMAILTAGIGFLSLQLANLEKSPRITPLEKISLATAIVICIGDLLFSLIQIDDINSFRWLLPILSALITNWAFEAIPMASIEVSKRPVLVNGAWAVFLIAFLILILAFTVLPAQRSPDVVQLYAPMLDVFKTPKFSITDPDQGNLWWYFLSRGRGLDIFLAKEFGADLHTYISTLFLVSASLASAALTQNILPLSTLRFRSVRLIPPLSAILVLTTPSFATVIGKFHAESFAILISLVLSIAILLKQYSRLAVILSMTSSLLLIFQTPMMALHVCFMWLLLAILISNSIKKRILALIAGVLSGCWGLTVVCLNIRAVGIGEVSPFKVFRFFTTRRLADWTSLDYLEYLNNSQGFTGLSISSWSSSINVIYRFLSTLPLVTTIFFSRTTMLWFTLIGLILITLLGAYFLRESNIESYQYRLSSFLIAVASSWVVSQIILFNGSISRLLFAQFSFVGLFGLSTSILLNRIPFSNNILKLFAKLFTLFLALMALLGLSNSKLLPTEFIHQSKANIYHIILLFRNITHLSFRQFSFIVFISLFGLITLVGLSRISFSNNILKLFPKLFVSFLALIALLGLSNSVSSGLYGIPRTHSLITRSNEALHLITGLRRPNFNFIYDGYIPLEFCGKIIKGDNYQGRILLLNSATVTAPICFAQYRQSDEVKFAETLEVELGRNFKQIMSHNPKLIREAFERAGVSQFVIVRGDFYFFGPGLSPIFGSSFLAQNVFVRAKAPDFYRLTLDPTLGRKLERDELKEILSLRDLAITKTPYADGLALMEKSDLVRR